MPHLLLNSESLVLDLSLNSLEYSYTEERSKNHMLVRGLGIWNSSGPRTWVIFHWFSRDVSRKLN